MAGIPDSIQEAIKNGDLGRLKDWLDKGGDLYARVENQESLLHKAAFAGHVPMIQLLLEKGLPLTIQDKSGYVPLHEAARNGQVEAVRCLIAAGADVDARTGQGKTADELAGEKGEAGEKIIALLGRARYKPRWIVTAEDEISHLTLKYELGYGLTEIFNFSNETYMAIARNLETKAESAVMKTFDELRRSPLLAAAEREFQSQGRKLPEKAPELDKPKPGLRPQN